MQLINHALVSVIIPVYKVEKYLEKCFISVVNQSYDNLEIILVDDGSPDNCGKLCEELALRDKRVKVVHKENGGLSSARNAGMEVAHGEFYYFLDSDDYIDERLIEQCVKKMSDNNADMVAFNYKKFTEDGKVWSANKIVDSSYIISSEKQRMKVITNHFFKYDFGYEAWNRMYRASIITDNKLKFAPNKLVFSEDICFNLCYLMYCNRIEVIDDELYYYLIRDDSIMGQSKAVIKVQQFTDLAKFVYKIIENSSLHSYIKNNYFVIMALLLDIQLSRVELDNRPEYITSDAFLKKSLKKIKFHILKNINILGALRGFKHSLLAAYYLSPTKTKKLLLQKVIKTNGN